MKLVIVKGVFNGIYFWGTGYKSGAIAEKWSDYWRNINSFFWHTFFTRDATYLVGTGGSLFLHPMDFDLILRKFGSTYRSEGGMRVEYYPEIDDLEKMCNEVAALCGGSFKMNKREVEV